ncbi:MAG: DegV family protein [Clostridiales bacterium]|nr:MAG: DegV family protein [Clostridiales bacterium]
MKIRIITDSASEMVSGEHLTVLPLTITFGTTEYADGVTLSHQKFYEKLIESDELPTTSQVTPFAFTEALKEAQANGEYAIIITLSSKLSGTYNSALIAAKDFPDMVHIIDSANVCIGEKILVEYALNLLNNGADAQEIIARTESKVSQICVIGLLDTLEYLRKGGRISNLSGTIGEILAIKPVITISDGVVAILGKARGSRKGNNLLTEQIAKNGGIDFSLPFALGYSGLDDSVLQKYIADQAQLWQGYTTTLPIDQIGATIGTHVGPGAIAVAFFHK